MSFFVFALLIGVVAGMRAMMAPAAVSWAARLGLLDLGGTSLDFLGSAWAPWLFTILAIGELITDQLPSTPSRKVPMQFGARLVTGGLAGGAIGAASGNLWLGVAMGVIGAIIGTLGGAALRGKLAESFGSDRPAALIEDAVAVIGALLIVSAA